ncbi:C40 family peptidase [Kribbella deserti]|uniref:C40 family peptidase n=1 Tax=Kribbella deserti TaxID=1926257 RepID=A0ABV6QSV0_9ACTN
MRTNQLKRGVATLVMAMATTLAGAAVVPTASYAAGLSNPSGTLTVKCPGAHAFIQVDWLGPNEVTIRWRIRDTAASGNVSPILRINAIAPGGSAAAMKFGNGKTYYVLTAGNGSQKVGLTRGWNPGNLGDISHLKVTVKNGTTAQGVDCHQSRNIFNWSRLAYDTALSKSDKGYRLGGMGPDYYDCSGLVLTSYNGIKHFPDFNTNNVRTAEQIYNWARTHTSPAKAYAKRVSPSDVKVGDLLFYRDTVESPRAVTHVAFWAGNNTLYDALSPTAGIGYHANTSWWSSKLVAVYRILGVSTD